MMDRLLLLDADVTIHFNTYNLWNGITKNYEVYLAETVSKVEVRHYPDLQRQKIPLDLQEQVRQGQVKEISASPEELKSIGDRLKPANIELDPGEKESIAVIDTKKIDGLKICIIDKSAIMAVAYLGLDAMAVSCEEVLKNCGMMPKGRDLPHKDFSKKRFEHWVTQGKFKLIGKKI